MVSPVVLAVASVGCFLALAHAAITPSASTFRRMTGAMAAVAVVLVAVSPAAGVALLAPVLLSRRLANAPVPATVDELLGRRQESADR
jgi:ABC-type transport system involved in cytochrome c biogenesis permease subunit